MLSGDDICLRRLPLAAILHGMRKWGRVCFREKKSACLSLSLSVFFFFQEDFKFIFEEASTDRSVSRGGGRCLCCL